MGKWISRGIRNAKSLFVTLKYYRVLNKKGWAEFVM